jgi:hypothetical protein
VTQLRGSVDGPYPVGDVSVWVSENDAECASELLLADEVEAAFDLGGEGEQWERRRGRPLLLGLSGTQLVAVLGVLLMLVSGVLARIIG